MYKIYINETPLLLTSPDEAAVFGPPTETLLVLRFSGKKKSLINIVHQLESSRRFERVVVFSKDLPGLWECFCSIYKIIEAAGGVVFNPDHQALLIFRRDHWDLPKGKIDPGESPAQAAIREVEEETGIGQIELGQHLTDTWHTYTQNGKRILKKTYWFAMKTAQTQLVPQAEEDIEQAVWQDLTGFLENPGHVYGSILDVLRKVKINESN